MQSSTTSSEPVRVLLVDDNTTMLARAAAVLKCCCVVVGRRDGRPCRPRRCRDVAAGRHRARYLDAGHDRLRGRRHAFVQAGSTAALVFLTVHDDEEFVQAATAAGGHRIRREAQARVRSRRRRARSAGGTAVRVGDSLSSAAEHAECGPRITRNTPNAGRGLRGTRRMRAADYAEHAESGRGLRGTRRMRPRTTRNTRNPAADYAEHAESGRGLRSVGVRFVR